MEFPDQYKGAIACSIIASIIVIYFLDPILSFLGKLFLYLTSIAFTSYLDGLYCKVAAGDPNYGFMFFLGAAGFIVGLNASIIWKFIKKDKKANERPLFTKGFLGLMSIVSIFLVIASVDNYVRLKTSSSFEQRMRFISPSISDQKYKELLSRYASMEGKSDYDEINRIIKEVALANGLNLPKNKLYPF